MKLIPPPASYLSKACACQTEKRKSNRTGEEEIAIIGVLADETGANSSVIKNAWYQYT
jgi:hypothetical protein